MAYEDKPWLLFPASDPMANPGAWGFNYDSGEWYPVNSGADPNAQNPNTTLAPEGMPNDGSGTLSVPTWTPSVQGPTIHLVDPGAGLQPMYDISAPQTGNYIPATNASYDIYPPGAPPQPTYIPESSAYVVPPPALPGSDTSAVYALMSMQSPGPGAQPAAAGPAAGGDPALSNTSVPWTAPAALTAPPPAPGAAPVGAPGAAPAGLSAGTPYVAPTAVMPGGGGSILTEDGTYVNPSFYGSGGTIDPYTGAPSSPFAAPMQPMAGGGGGYGAPPPGPFPFGHAGVPNPMPPAAPMRNHVLGALGLPGPAWAPATQPPPQPMQQPLDPTRQAIIDGLTQVPAPPPPPMSPMRYVEAKLGLEPESIVPPPPYAGGPKAFMPPVPTQDQQKAMFPNTRRAMPPMGGMGY
jgi:hypothetical protein